LRTEADVGGHILVLAAQPLEKRPIRVLELRAAA
jgi:hypothetical protein